MNSTVCCALFVIAIVFQVLAVDVDPIPKPEVGVVHFKVGRNGTTRSFDLLLSDGQYRMESITFPDDANPDRPIEVTGQYSYSDNKGKPITVTYTAGVDGYVARVKFEPRIQISTRKQNRILPIKVQGEDGIGCALRASLCG